MTVGIRNINPNLSPKNMREVNAFAVANNLLHLLKMQGGYYFINKNRQFEFLARALYLFSFTEYYNTVKR